MKFASRLVVSASVFLLTVGSAAAMTAVAVVDLNVRSGPGTRYPVIAVIPRGDVADATNCSAGWCQVAYRGNMGWASQAYLNLTGNAYYNDYYTGPYYNDYYYPFGLIYTWPYYNNYYYGGAYYPNRPGYYPNRPGRVDGVRPAPRTTLSPYRHSGIGVQRPHMSPAPGLRAGGARVGGAMHGGGAPRR